MKDFIVEFIKKLHSRKFLIALGTTATCIASKQYGEAISVVVAYLIAEGYIDAKRSKDITSVLSQLIKEGYIDEKDIKKPSPF